MNKNEKFEQLMNELETVSVQALECAEKKDVGTLTGLIHHRSSLLEKILGQGVPETGNARYTDMFNALLDIDNLISAHIKQDMEDTRQSIEQSGKQKKLSRRFNRHSVDHAMIVNQRV